VEPFHIGVGVELADVAAEAHIEDDTSADVLLDQDQRRQAERAGQGNVVAVLRWEQGRLSQLVLKRPAGHPENGRSRAATADLVSVPGVQAFAEARTGLSFGFVKISGV
jgi:hypothetical protein